MLINYNIFVATMKLRLFFPLVLWSVRSVGTHNMFLKPTVQCTLDLIHPGLTVPYLNWKLIESMSEPQRDSPNLQDISAALAMSRPSGINRYSEKNLRSLII